MKIHHFTDVGTVRTNNEDRLFIHPASKTFAVCDGMGGHACGELAAQSIADELGVRANLDPNFHARELAQSLHHANSVCQSFRDGRGSTATVVRIRGKLLDIAHVGDTRLGVLDRETKEVVWLTKDQGRGHILYNGVGFLEYVHTEEFELTIEKPILVLTSDGVHDYLDDRQIYSLVTADQSNPAQYLCEAALEAGSRDNVTAIVICLE